MVKRGVSTPWNDCGGERYIHKEPTPLDRSLHYSQFQFKTFSNITRRCQNYYLCLAYLLTKTYECYWNQPFITQSYIYLFHFTANILKVLLQDFVTVNLTLREGVTRKRYCIICTTKTLHTQHLNLQATQHKHVSYPSFLTITEILSYFHFIEMNIIRMNNTL